MQQLEDPPKSPDFVPLVRWRCARCR